MLIIPLKDGENIERALKRYKRKFDRTGARKALYERKQFEKPSVVKRAQVQKAQKYETDGHPIVHGHLGSNK